MAKKKSFTAIAKAAIKQPEPVIISPKPVPVEGSRPGTLRNPKPKKVLEPLKFEGVAELRGLEIIGGCFIRLLERLAAENGGAHAVALEELRDNLAAARK